MAGSTVSIAGNRITSAAFPLLLLHLTGSAVAAGWGIVIANAPGIIACIPAGALVDHWEPRRTILVSGLARGVTIAAIVDALIMHWAPVWFLLGSGAIAEISRLLMRLAEHNLTDSLVQASDATMTIARTELNNSVTALIGKPAGELLFSLRPVLPLLAETLAAQNAISLVFLMRANQVSGERVRGSHPGAKTLPTRKRKLARAFFAEGFSWLRQNQYAKVAMMLAAGSVLLGGALEATFIAEADAMHAPRMTLGCALAAFGVGGCIGSGVASRLHRRFGYVIVKIQAWVWPTGFAFLAAFGVRSVLVPAVGMLFFGIAGAIGNIALEIYLYNKVSEEIGARVVSVGFAMTCASLLLGAPLGGMLAEHYGTERAFLVLLLVSSAWLLTTFMTPATTKPEPSSAVQPKSAHDHASHPNVSGSNRSRRQPGQDEQRKKSSIKMAAMRAPEVTGHIPSGRKPTDGSRYRN